MPSPTSCCAAAASSRARGEPYRADLAFDVQRAGRRALGLPRRRRRRRLAHRRGRRRAVPRRRPRGGRGGRARGAGAHRVRARARRATLADRRRARRHGAARRGRAALARRPGATRARRSPSPPSAPRPAGRRSRVVDGADPPSLLSCRARHGAGSRASPTSSMRSARGAAPSAVLAARPESAGTSLPRPPHPRRARFVPRPEPGRRRRLEARVLDRFIDGRERR